MNCRGMIFDLDGTLLDSMDVWDHIGETYLRRRGITDIPDDLEETLKPLSLLQAAEYFIEHFAVPMNADEIADDVNRMIEEAYRHRVGLKEGAREFLQTHAGVKKCIATATDRYLVEFALDRLGLSDAFSFILTSAEVGTGKQSPEIYLQAAEKLGVPVSQIVVFEDALHAVQTAKKAGFYTVGVYEPVFAAETEQIRRAADRFVCHLNEFEVP